MPVEQNANSQFRWTHTCGTKSLAFQQRRECAKEFKDHLKKCSEPDDTRD